MIDFETEKRIWWSYLEEDLQELIKESVVLIKIAEKWEEKFHDYAFVVFPAAKAYEGFLKRLFLDLGFITDEDYYGKRFRIGKALNPSLEKRLRARSGVYDKLVDFCGGLRLADLLWETWKEARNLIFHWFPNERNAITYEEAQKRVVKILYSMDEAFRECKIDRVKE